MKFNFIKSVAVISAVSALFTASLMNAQAQTESAEKNPVVQFQLTENKKISAPVISSLKSTVNGLEVKWSAVDTAVKYAVYRKTKNTSAKLVAEVKDTVYNDSSASSGVTYIYLLKCIDEEGNSVSDFSKSKSLHYIKTPVIKKITNSPKGAVITWGKIKGAKKYTVYYLKNKKWKKLATVKSASYTHKKLTSGKTYTYRIRAINSKGKFVGGLDYKGVKNLFVAPPVISSVSNNTDSISVKWNKAKGAAAYNVYRKTGDGKYVKLDCVDVNKFVDKNVTSGEKYTYTVRCVDAEGKFISASSTSKSVRFVKAPEILGFINTSDGTKITWSASAGASKYAVYMLNSKKEWKKLAVVTSTSYVHQNLKNGTTYTYTVRCLNKNSKSVSTVRGGAANMFIAPVKLTQISSVENGTLIKWNKVSGADKYDLFRMKESSKWEKIYSGAELSFVDSTAEKDTLYQYALRCADEDNNYISYIDSNPAYYYNGAPADGTFKIGDKTYKFIKGYYRRGIQIIDGKTYYYDSEGELKKNGIVGSEKEGWYYADKNGIINLNYVNGFKDKNGAWIIINGKARKVKTKSDKTLFRAAKVVAKATKPEMTQSEKLRACFNYVKKSYIELNPRIPHYNKKDWPVLYANDMFVDGAGNCFSYAAAFAYMARAIGYTDVYCCHSGGHGWAEIDGKVYDPEWSRHHKDKSYFGLSYKQVPHYKSAIKKNISWMYVKIK